MYFAKLQVYQNEDEEVINNYSTLVSYHNSLRDVGVVSSRVYDDVYKNIKSIYDRLNIKDSIGIINKKEITSRILNNKIKSSLKEIENKFLDDESNKKLGVDLVLATNMLSVGIDIGRLNIMLMNSIPKNTAEYIQASSRVGRKTKGLVITLLNPFKARDKSYMEHFKNFHQQFYKSIEPLSLTPLTKPTIDKLLVNLATSYIRHKKEGLNKDDGIKNFQEKDLEELKNIIGMRFEGYEKEKEYFKQKLQKFSETLEDKKEKMKDLEGRKFKYKNLEGIVYSLRDIDPNTFIKRVIK